ncbi:MAG: hypothetical protein ACHQEB_02080 [Chitinophagales bacterium]
MRRTIMDLFQTEIYKQHYQFKVIYYSVGTIPVSGERWKSAIRDI